MHYKSQSPSSPRSPAHTDTSVDVWLLNDTVWEDTDDKNFLHSPIKTTYDFFNKSGGNFSPEKVNTAPVRKYKSFNNKSPRESAQKNTSEETKSGKYNSDSKLRNRRNQDEKKHNGKHSKKSKSFNDDYKRNNRNGGADRDGLAERKSSRSSRSSRSSDSSTTISLKVVIDILCC